MNAGLALSWLVAAAQINAGLSVLAAAFAAALGVAAYLRARAGDRPGTPANWSVPLSVRYRWRGNHRRGAAGLVPARTVIRRLAPAGPAHHAAASA